MRKLLLFLLAAALPGQAFIVENLASAPQRAWVFAGLPAAQMPKGAVFAVNPEDLTAPGWLVVPARGGVWMLADLPAATSTKVELQPADASDVPVFQLAAGVQLAALLPTFWAIAEDGDVTTSAPPQFWPAGAPRPAGAVLWQEQADGAHQLWHLRTRLEACLLTVDCWARIGSGCTTVEWTVQAVYGDTRAEQPISTHLAAFGMSCGAEPVVDFAVRAGVPAAARDGARWRQQLAGNLDWGRASRLEWRGAWLCKADPARRQFPLGAVCTSWDGDWLALGTVPPPPTDATAISARRLEDYRTPAAGTLYDQRREAQPKVSGTTGEQPDFGCTNGGEAVTLLHPWAVHWYLWQAQSYSLRPTGNKEPNGDPVKASDHPRTVTGGLRPDDRYSRADMIGWPPAIPYSWPGSGYFAEDEQHRSEGLIAAVLALTRDPALEQVMQDRIEMQALALRRGEPTPGGGTGSPRALGRMLLAMSQQVWLGFADARPQLKRLAMDSAISATMTGTPHDDMHPVRVFNGDDEAKYGWKDAAGNPIRGWQGWQETIAAIGEWAAARQLGDDITRQLALEAARSVTRQCWYEWQGQLRHVYAERWRTEDPGSAHPASSWFPTQPNYDINTDGAGDYWTACSARILLAGDLLPSDPLYKRCLQLTATAPVGWARSQWAALK
jgi:hypothetical protein